MLRTRQNRPRPATIKRARHLDHNRLPRQRGYRRRPPLSSRLKQHAKNPLMNNGQAPACITKPLVNSTRAALARPTETRGRWESEAKLDFRSKQHDAPGPTAPARTQTHALHLRTQHRISDQARPQGKTPSPGWDLLISSDLALRAKPTHAARRRKYRAVTQFRRGPPPTAQGKTSMVMVLDGRNLIQPFSATAPRAIVELVRIKGGRMSTLEGNSNAATPCPTSRGAVAHEHLAPHQTGNQDTCYASSKTAK